MALLGRHPGPCNLIQTPDAACGHLTVHQLSHAGFVSGLSGSPFRPRTRVLVSANEIGMRLNDYLPRLQ